MIIWCSGCQLDFLGIGLFLDIWIKFSNKLKTLSLALSRIEFKIIEENKQNQEID